MTETIPEKLRSIIILKTPVFIIPLVLFCGCSSKAESQQGSSGFSAGSMEEEAGRIIQKVLASDNPQARASAIEVVASIPVKQAQKFMPEVQRLLQDEFVPVRFAAAVAIGDTGYSPAKNDVRRLVKDKDQNVRLAADYALSKLTPATSIEPIQAALKNPDLQVRANAAFLLGKAGDQGGLPLLYETLRDETSDDRVRFNAVEAIARLGDEKIYKRIWAMLISTYADDRVTGIRAMGALGTTQARDDLVRMLKDDLVEVRLVAAEQLGGLEDTSGEKIVVDALTKGNTDAGAPAQDREGKARIQTLCVRAIGKIKTAALKKFLPELLKSELLPVKLTAAGAVFQSR